MSRQQVEESIPVPETETAATQADHPFAPEQTQPAEEPADGAQAPEEEDKLVTVVEHIRAQSRHVLLTDPDVFLGAPFNFTEDELAEVFADMEEEEGANDIVRTRDERSGKVYLHSEMLLSVPYAKLVLRKQANDPIYLIVETAREESQMYPHPVSIQTFELAPFDLSAEEASAAVETILETSDYDDIKSVTPSNGVLYLYSDRYLSAERSLEYAEWIEVGRHEPGNQ